MQALTSFLTTPLPPIAYTLIGIAVVILFAVHGAFRGIFRMLFLITSLILAYPLAKPFGDALLPFLPFENIPSIVIEPVLTAIGGTVAYILLWLLFLMVTRLFRLNRERQGWGRIIVMSGGALIGGLFGALLVLLFSWFLLIMGTLVAAMPGLSQETEESSALRDAVLLPARFVAGHSEAFRESRLGEIAKESTPAPAEKLESSMSVATEVLKNPHSMEKLIEYEPIADIIKGGAVQDLMANEEIRKMAAEGNIFGILNHPATKAMLSDPKIQEALANIDPKELQKMLQE